MRVGVVCGWEWVGRWAVLEIGSVTTEISVPKHFKVEVESQDIALFAPPGRICAAAL